MLGQVRGAIVVAAVDVPSSGDRGFVLAARGAAAVIPEDRSLDRSVESSTLDRRRILEDAARGRRGC